MVTGSKSAYFSEGISQISVQSYLLMDYLIQNIRNTWYHSLALKTADDHHFEIWSAGYTRRRYWCSFQQLADYEVCMWQGRGKDFFQKGKGVVNCATPKLPTRLTIRYLHDFFRRDLSSCRVLSLDSVFATWVMRFAFCRILSMGAQCSKTSPCLGLNAEVSEGSKQQVFELRSADFAKEEQSGHNLIFVAFWTQNHVRSQEVHAQLDGPSAKLYCSFPPSFFHTAINKYHQGLNNMNLSCNCWTAGWEFPPVIPWCKVESDR